MAAIVFGSEEARAVLLADRQRRIGYVRIYGQKDPGGEMWPPPANYVPATWADWEPEPDDGEDWESRKGNRRG